MKFKYQAKTKTGEDQVGFVEAADREAATSILLSHNLFILSLEETGHAHWYDRIAGYFGGVRRKDRVIFFRQLATLLDARIPLATALRNLYEQTANADLREAIYQISEDIDAGLSFSQAMDRRRGVFSEFYVSMVQAAEETGKLDEVVSFLADYTEKEDLLASKAVGALIYPALIVGLFIVVAFVMVAFVFPQIKPIFDSSGVTLPIFTQILLTVGGFLGTWWPIVLVIAVFGGILLFDYLHTSEGRSLLDDLKVRTPFLNRLYVPLVIARSSYTMALLLRGGIPIAQALEIVSHTVGNVLYQELFHDVAETVREGEPVSQAMKKYPEYFPSLAPQMLSVGEASGQENQMFSRLAAFYERQADDVIGNIVNLIQPLMIMAIGLLVGLLFASILLPLYQLTGSFT